MSLMGIFHADNINSLHLTPGHTPIRFSGLIRRGAEDESIWVVQIERQAAGIVSMKLMAATRGMPHVFQGLGGSHILESLQETLGSHRAIALLQQTNLVALLLELLVPK